MKRGHDFTAGVALALATLLRVFPIAIVGYLILQRRWRALAYLTASLAIGLLLTVAFSGIHNTLSFFANMSSFAGHAAAAIQRDLAIELLHITRTSCDFAASAGPQSDPHRINSSCGFRRPRRDYKGHTDAAWT